MKVFDAECIVPETVKQCVEDEFGDLDDFKVTSKDRKSNTKCTWKMKITLPHLVSLIVGSVIGKSLFTYQSNVLSVTTCPSSALLLYFMGFLYACVGCACHFHLATLVPYNCADYLFIYEFNGKLVSFMYAFCNGIFCRPIRITVTSVLVADWLLFRLDRGCQSILWYRISLSALVILCFCGIQIYNTHFTLRLNSFLNMLACALVCVITMGSYIHIRHHEDDDYNYISESAAETHEVDGTNSYRMMYMVTYIFSGWDIFTSCIEEIREIQTQKILRKGILLSMSLVFICYLFMNLSIYSTLTFDELMNTDQIHIIPNLVERIVEDFTDDETFHFIMNYTALVIGLVVVASVCAMIHTNSRYICILGRDNNMPVIVGMMDIVSFTPSVAIILTSAISLFYLSLPDSTLEWLLECSVCVELIMNACLGCSQYLFVILYMDRTLAKKAYPIVSLIFSIWSVVLVMCCIRVDTRFIGLVMILLVLAWAVYVIVDSCDNRGNEIKILNIGS